MKRLVSSAVLLGLSGLISACSIMPDADIKQKRIFTRYDVKHVAGESLRFEAAFKVNNDYSSTVLELGEGSSVSLNGYEMRKEQDRLTNYVSYVYDIGAPAERDLKRNYEIVYVNQDKQQFRNSVQIPELPGNDLTTLSQVSLAGGTKINWNFGGIPLAAQEMSLDLYQESSDGKDASSNQVNVRLGSRSAGDIELQPAHLNGFRPNRGALLQLCTSYWKTKNLQAPEAGGALHATSCTPKRRVTVVW
jgi:hypothetical protein